MSKRECMLIFEYCLCVLPWVLSVDGDADSGSWCHCLPIRICLWLWEEGCTVVVSPLFSLTDNVVVIALLCFLLLNFGNYRWIVAQWNCTRWIVRPFKSPAGNHLSGCHPVTGELKCYPVNVCMTYRYAYGNIRRYISLVKTECISVRRRRKNTDLSSKSKVPCVVVEKNYDASTWRRRRRRRQKKN